jgi:Protein of unknown function (DUF3142)
MKVFHSRSISMVSLAALGVLCIVLRSDALPMLRAHLSVRMNMLPRKILWVWERPEDLRAIDAIKTAIAWLDQTVVISEGVVSVPRRQPLAYPAGAARIAVVRIETLPAAKLNPAQEQQTVALLLRSAERPGIGAMQVDFDATRSQRAFYSHVLTDLRRRMPATLPLSMTALASWCSSDDWIADLPVDEAVPMMFRMEPDRRRASADSPWFRIREPLCMGSVGVSTHERWPDEMAGKRIYVFADRGWRQDLSLLNNRKLR